MKVQTTKGLIEREELRAVEIISEEDNARVVATEWFMGDELVRRDVHVSILRALEINTEQESL